MGWPLLLALASTAANKTAQDSDTKAGRKYNIELATAEGQKNSRDMEDQVEEARRAALMRALKAGAQPLTAPDMSYLDEPEEPVSAADKIAGLTQAANIVGGYMAGKSTPKGV